MPEALRMKWGHVCAIHGNVCNDTGWLPCWNGCDEGYFDAYEEDPINEDPGTFEECRECRGRGGWIVCGVCNRDNPEVEW